MLYAGRQAGRAKMMRAGQGPSCRAVLIIVKSCLVEDTVLSTVSILKSVDSVRRTNSNRKVPDTAFEHKRGTASDGPKKKSALWRLILGAEVESAA